MAFGDGPSHEGILGLQVEDVVLVDARRHDHERVPVNPLRRRRVLQELDQLVAKDDAAGRHGEVAPDLERLLVAHRDPAALRIGGEVGEPPYEARPLGGERALQHLGIGRHEVRRRERVDVLPRQEGERLLLVLGQRSELGELAQVLAEQKVALLQQREVGQLAPLGGSEAAIAGGGMRDVRHLRPRLRVGAERTQGRCPQGLPAHLISGVELGETPRIERG